MEMKHLTIHCLDATGAVLRKLRMSAPKWETVNFILKDVEFRCRSHGESEVFRHMRLQGFGGLLDRKERLEDVMEEHERVLEALQTSNVPSSKVEETMPLETLTAFYVKRVQCNYEPEDTNSSQMRVAVGEDMKVFGGQRGWHFCEHAASGECGFVPGWVFDDPEQDPEDSIERRPSQSRNSPTQGGVVGAVSQVVAMTGSYIDSLKFILRNGEESFHGTNGGYKREVVDLDADEAILEVEQMEKSYLGAIQLRTNKRAIDLKGYGGPGKKNIQRNQVKCPPGRQIRDLIFKDQILMGCRHTRLHRRYLPRREKLERRKTAKMEKR